MNALQPFHYHHFARFPIILLRHSLVALPDQVHGLPIESCGSVSAFRLGGPDSGAARWNVEGFTLAQSMRDTP